MVSKVPLPDPLSTQSLPSNRLLFGVLSLVKSSHRENLRQNPLVKRRLFIRGEETRLRERAHTHMQGGKDRDRESKGIAGTWEATIQPLHRAGVLRSLGSPHLPLMGAVKTKTGRPTGPLFGSEHVLVWP